MPSFLIVIPLIVLGLIVAWIAFSRPFVGLLLIFAINPLDFIVKLPDWLSLGRFLAFIVLLGWLNHLNRHGAIVPNLKRLYTLKVGWLFIVACTLGVFLSGFPYAGASRLATITLLWVLSMMVEDMVRDGHRIRVVLLVFALSSAFLAVLPVADYFKIDLPGVENLHYVGEGSHLRSSGITANPNGLALILNISIFWSILFVLQSRSLIRSLLFSVVIAMCFIALVLSGSRTHFIALLAFLGILCLLRIWGPSRGLLKSALGLIVASAILVGAFLAGPEYARNRLLMKHSSRNTAEERLAFADTQRALALNFAVQRPLFGIGLGQFVEHPTTGSYYADAHDTVSVLLGETGFLGTLTFLPILFFALFQSARWMVRHSRLKNMDDYYFGLVMLAILGSMILAGLGGYVIVYQRLFWLVVGLSATLARAAMPTSRPVRDARPLPPHDSARPVEAPGPA